MARRIGIEVSPSIVGGTETFLSGMLSALGRSAYRPLALFHSNGPTKTLFDERGIDTHVVNYASEQDGALAEVVAFLRAEQIALLQSSYFSPVLALAASHARIPHVWRVGGHVDVVHARNSEHQRRMFLAVATFLSRKVICGSHFLRRQFDGLVDAQVEVIYNGLDLRAFDASSLATPRPGPQVAMVAHFIDQKRHEDFIRAAAMVVQAMPDTRFWIFGAPYPFEASRQYAATIEALITQLGLDSVMEIEHLTADRFARMREMTLFVLPSLNEGASNAILEAMALGKPVIAADSGGHPELVSHQRTGYLVPPNDASALADRITELLTQADLATAMGAAGRAEVDARFDVRHCARRYEELYDAVIADSQ